MKAASSGLRAYVLHRYDWSESSLILDVFTRERGRLAVAAKGAKRPYSQLRGVLMPFHPLLLTLGRQPADETAEILNLRGAEWAGGCAMLRGSALFAGFYLNELVMKMLARQDPHPRLFDIYAHTLIALQGPDSAARPALRAFEMMLLREAGYLPDLGRVTLTRQPVLPELRYRLIPEAGVVAAGEGAAEVEAMLDGRTLLRLSAALEDLQELRRACAEAEPALQAAMKTLLHYHLGRAELRSRQVLEGFRRLWESCGNVPAA